MTTLQSLFVTHTITPVAAAMFIFICDFCKRAGLERGGAKLPFVVRLRVQAKNTENALGTKLLSVAPDPALLKNRHFEKYREDPGNGVGQIAEAAVANIFFISRCSRSLVPIPLSEPELYQWYHRRSCKSVSFWI